jgi:hypothetical protein
MDSKQQFRSGKPVTQSLHQIAFAIAAVGVSPLRGRQLSRRINGRTDITWLSLGYHLAITWRAAAPREPHAGIDTCFCRQTAHRAPTA